MAGKEQVKLYALIGLAIVAATIAYVRFGPGRKARVATDTPAAASAPQAALDVPPIAWETYQFADQTGAVVQAFEPAKRDIFVPGRSLAALGRPVYWQTMDAQSNGVLELKGVSMGGARAAAIIGDRVVRTGDRIDDYRVVKIARDRVVLSSGSGELVLRLPESKEESRAPALAATIDRLVSD